MRRVNEWFATVASAHADQVAVQAGATTLTYRDLDLQADAVAARLRAAGVKPADIVAVRVGRAVDSVAAMLGVWKAGAAFVSLDATYPQHRLDQIIESARPTAFVDGTGSGSDLIEPGPRRDDGQLDTVDDLAYVVYTSGSTGVPKGCMIRHDNLAAFLKGTLSTFDLGWAERWTVFHSFGFDASVWELWGALLSGATAVLVPERALLNPSELLDLLIRERISVLSQVPSVFKYLVDTYERSARPDLSLRFIFSVGEAIRLDLIDRFQSLVGSAGPTFANMYGPTETTVFATAKTITGADLRGQVRSPIGSALPGVVVMVADADGSPVRDGGIGEIWIGGELVGAGYLRRPDLTAERFVDVLGQRYYRTGDLGRHLGGDEFEYLGRADHQIKLRGFRIEIEDVETNIRESDVVDDVGVCVCHIGPATFLVACIVLVAGAPPDWLTSVRRICARRLPKYMRPDRYTVVDRLPQTSSGKLDRQRLAQLAQLSHVD